MTALRRLYGRSLSLLTDLYQLTMAYGLWKSGVAGREAVFHLFFRRIPFGGGYAVACGLQAVLDHLRDFRFTAEDLAYLGGLRGNDGAPLFEPAFLRELGEAPLQIELDAVPEGSLVFAHEPLLRVRGPLLACQILETPLLNLVNFPTLIATKAARITRATGGDPVLEFGLRRAQGIDGAVAASRAAYLGGCAGTSNVLAGKLYGIPVKGTHAHSWVMCFDSEPEAFRAYAGAMPNNCVFLVDTYDTLQGIEHAIEVGRWLRERGYRMAGIRLDSGDLAHLSKEARRRLDEAGFEQAAIVASNDLDEHVIESLKQQGARIGVWGVGTRLVTAYDEPALGGVYKLAGVRDPGEDWTFKIKLSEQPIKISTPGVQQVRRFYRGGEMVGDLIYDVGRGPGEPDGEMHDIEDPTRRRAVPDHTETEDLLVPILRGGRAVYEAPPLEEARARALGQLESLNARSKRLLNPQPYPVGLERRLHDLKWSLVERARREEDS